MSIAVSVASETYIPKDAYDLASHIKNITTFPLTSHEGTLAFWANPFSSLLEYNFDIILSSIAIHISDWNVFQNKRYLFGDYV